MAHKAFFYAAAERRILSHYEHLSGDIYLMCGKATKPKYAGILDSIPVAVATITPTSYQYAIRTAVGVDRYLIGRTDGAYASSYTKGVGFAYNDNLEAAQLFATAAEAEAAITDRNAANWSDKVSQFVVVPVKVTTTTVTTPDQPRIIRLMGINYRVVNGVVQQQTSVGWLRSSSFAADRTLGGLETSVTTAEVGQIIDLLRNPTIKGETKTVTKRELA